MVSSAKGGGDPSNLVRTSGAPAESLMICKQKLLFIRSIQSIRRTKPDGRENRRGYNPGEAKAFA